MSLISDKEFFTYSAPELAHKLLGKLLCRRFSDGSVVKYRITETECYYGFDDSANHASKSLTVRTKPMFESGGICYVYLCYGIHEMLNIVSGAKNHPEAVLIRSLENLKGPGVLTKYLKIDRTFNYEDLTISSRLWLENDGKEYKCITDKRIGINYAEPKDQARQWRFILYDDSLSKKKNKIT